MTPKHIPAAYALSLILVLLLNTCSPSGSDTGAVWPGTMDTLATGEILVRNADVPFWAQPWQVEEVWRIGSNATDGPELFGRIGSLDVDAQGRVYVLDDQANEVRIFDAQGRHVRTFGRPGDGPGEFANVSAIDLSEAGEIWVMQMHKGHLAIFDTTGRYVRGKRSNQADMIRRPYLGGFDWAGRYNVMIPYIVDEEYSWALARFDQSLLPIDTIPVPRSPLPTRNFELNSNGTVMSMGVPFHGEFSWRYSPGGNLWTLLGDRYELAEITAAGTRLRTVTKDHKALPVTAEDRQEIGDNLEWFTAQGGEIDWTLIPTTKPAVESFFCDDEGNLWVRRRTDSSDDEGRLFDIFDAEGRFLGTLRLPFELLTSPEPVVREGILYGEITDASGGPAVVRARVVRP